MFKHVYGTLELDYQRVRCIPLGISPFEDGVCIHRAVGDGVQVDDRSLILMFRTVKIGCAAQK